MNIKEEVTVGFQDSSANITDISESSIVAIVDIGRENPKILELPKEGSLTFHMIIILYLNSMEFKSLSVNTRSKKFYYLCDFFKYLNHYKSDSLLPLNIISEYLQYLRSENVSGLYNKINILKQVVSWAFLKVKIFSEKQKNLCRKYHMNAPDIKKPEYNKAFPLSQLISGCPYNDTEILDSLRKLCIWIINYESELREELLSLESIRYLVKRIESKSIYKTPISHSCFNNDEKEGSRDLYGLLIQAIRNHNNSVLKERIVNEIGHPFDKEVLTENEMNFVLDQSIMKTRIELGLPPKCLVQYKIFKKNLSSELSLCLPEKDKNHFYVGSFKCFPLRNLLVQNDIEMFAMQLLLASEKINLFSIDELTLDDVVVVKKGIQFQTKKIRRPISKRVNITALHPIGSILGKTYLRFFRNKKAAEKYYNEKDGIKLLVYRNKGVKTGAIGLSRFTSAGNSHFEKLITENSHLRIKLINSFGDDFEALAPILWLISRVLKVNQEVYSQEKLNDKHRFSENGSSTRGSFVSTKSVNLSSSAVRQSAITSEDAKIFNNPSLFNDYKVIAQLSNHSLSVHNEIYLDRSTAKEKIDLDRQFTSRIGELMVSDSEKIRDLVNRTKVYDHNEALEELGLPRTDQSASEKLAKEIDALGIDIDLMDSFSINGTKIFIANKTTTALIIKYLEHIRTNFDDISIDDSPRLTKTTLAARDYFYFSSILQKFPTDVRKEGEAYAKSLSFEYAKLLDIAGISNEK